MTYEELQDNIIARLEHAHQRYLGAYDSHIERVKNAMSWIGTFAYQEYPYSENGENTLVNARVSDPGRLNGALCVITHIDFRGAPYFCAEIRLTPYNSIADIGEGCGMSITKSF